MLRGLAGAARPAASLAAADSEDEDNLEDAGPVLSGGADAARGHVHSERCRHAGAGTGAGPEEGDGGHGHSHSHGHGHGHGHAHGSHDHSEELRVYRMSTCDKLSECEAFRAEASLLYAEGHVARAKAKLQKVIVYLDYTFTETPEERARESEVRFAAELGMAICALTLNNLRECEALATRALESKPDSARAFFARAKARRLLADLGGASKDLAECLRLAPRNVHALEERKLLLRAQAKYERDAEALAKGMFRGASSAAAGGPGASSAPPPSS